jgi:hypothetical protein
MEPLRIAAGSKVLLGAPASPLPNNVTAAIREVVSQLPGVLEAHLPQCFVAGVIDPPAQVLVIVVKSNASKALALELLSVRLPRILPEGLYLDVWPLELGHLSLTSVRKANCRIV